jgi:hypothetical protein
MSINFTKILSEERIEWFDRGANTSRGHISIRCPWCGPSDPSHHLSINESTGAYFCYRNSKHAGRSAPWLLKALGVNPRRIDSILASAGIRRTEKIEPERQREVPQWNRFVPATQSETAIAYMRERGFPDPEQTIKKFDLRVALNGPNAQRLLFPIIMPSGDIAFTGRALQPNMTPKYLTHESVRKGIYVPKPIEHPKLALLVEGPFDALKIAAFEPNILVIALLGLAMSAEKISQIIACSEGAQFYGVAIDSTEPVSKAYGLIHELSIAVRKSAFRCELPGSKDPGEMSGQEIRAWLDTYRNGKASLKIMRGATLENSFGV